MNLKKISVLLLLVFSGYKAYDYSTSTPPIEIKLSSDLMVKFKSISPLEMIEKENSGFGKMQVSHPPCYGPKVVTGKNTSDTDDYAIWGCVRSDCPELTVSYKSDSTVIVKADAKKTEYAKDKVIQCALLGIEKIDPNLRATSPAAEKKASWSK